MKKIKQLLIASLVVLISLNNLSGQEADKSINTELRKFGIGLNFEQTFSNPWYYYYYPSGQLIFTYNIADRFRIEPELGFDIVNYHDDYDNTDERHKELAIGIGGYGLSHKNSICAIYGIKFDYLSYLRTRENSSDSRTTFKAVQFGPVIGLDYFISSHVSIGADFRIMYLAELYQYDYDNNDQVTEESSYKNLNTVAALKFRFYF